MTETDAKATNFNDIVGLTVSETSPDRVVVELTLGVQHLQPSGIPHDAGCRGRRNNDGTGRARCHR